MDGGQFAPGDDKVPADGGRVSLNLPRMAGQDEKLAQLFGTGQPDPGNEQVFAKNQRSLSPERYAKYRETWWK